jgi:hypothetical protein
VDQRAACPVPTEPTSTGLDYWPGAVGTGRWSPLSGRLASRRVELQLNASVPDASRPRSRKVAQVDLGAGHHFDAARGLPSQQS